MPGWRLPRRAAALAALLLAHAMAVAQEAPAAPAAALSPVENPAAIPAAVVPAPFKAGRGVPGEGQVLVDSAGTLTFEQVRSKFDAGEGRAVQPSEIMPTGGGAALWYRLALPAVAAPTPLMLTIPHPNMDSVTCTARRPAAYGRWSGPATRCLSRSGRYGI